MPYLKSIDRVKVDVILGGGDIICERFSHLTAQELAGAVNYLNFKIIKTWIKFNEQRYWIFALFVGTLICCVLEVYRRLIAPYEDKAIEKNGDVE